MRFLRDQAQGLKETANICSDDKKKLTTRLKALERELCRRERLIRTLDVLGKSGQGIGADIIDKLREERNLLPVHRKSLQGVLQQIQERDDEIRAVKHDEKFTKIIELQVEYASWQHEAQRLNTILQEPEGELAQREAEVHANRVGDLEQRLESEKQRCSVVEEKLAAKQETREAARQQYEVKKAALEQEQASIREIANRYKVMLEKRKEGDLIENAVCELRLRHGKLSEELDAIALRHAELEACSAELSSSAHLAVSDAVLHGAAAEPPAPVAAAWALRQELLRLDAEGTSGPLLSRLRALDPESTGFISEDDLACALSAAAEKAAPIARDACGSCAGLLPPKPSGETGGESIRWLDWLVAFDRMGSGFSSASSGVQPSLPEVRPLRAACLKAHCSVEELRERILGVATRDAAKACFDGLSMDMLDANDWVEAWWHFGAAGLLARLPLSEATMPKAVLEAWLARCAFATKKEGEDLKAAFSDFPQQQLLEGQFIDCCKAVLSAELSLDDVEDLALMSASADGHVDGTAFLSAWCSAA